MEPLQQFHPILWIRSILEVKSKFTVLDGIACDSIKN